MYKAWFRFYEELNDFLPGFKRKRSFEYSFSGNPSIKDAIEAIGVPHVEVDLIIVNGKPVTFSYKMRDQDKISVYPVFESFDISDVSPLRDKPLRITKFIADVHLGKLSRYLRLCGFDTNYDTSLTDFQIIDISLMEKRIILTRDRNLLKHKKVIHGYWVRSTRPRQQLKEIVIRFNLINNFQPFSRCMECNGVLNDVEKEQVTEQLLPGTNDNFTYFKQCKNCSRIYWEGSHYERMKELITSISNY